MTDFIVSKVAMSVCALLVAGALTETVGQALSPCSDDDLEHVLASLEGRISILIGSGAVASLDWTVPSLPSGEEIEMVFSDGHVSVRSERLTRVSETMPKLHTWLWEGTAINWTKVEELDSLQPEISCHSGDVVELSTVPVTIEEETILLAFISPEGAIPV